tara:strand:+ start:1614 stop:2633 length:1020 start_codon:yes stop_codon:yes gene_type:complete
MKNKLFLITNESIYVDKNKNFFCDNIDLKSIPENLEKYSEINIIGRHSKTYRSKKIGIKNINIFKNIFTYLFCIFRSFKQNNAKYLIISLSPYTFIASLLLKFYSKKHFIYLRSDGFEEYKAIFGYIGSIIYYVIFKIGIINSNLIACREHLLRKNNGAIVNPSQLKKKWFEDLKTMTLKELNFLYVGRLRIEKGIFSLIEIIENSNFNLTIVTSEKDAKLKKNYKNINLTIFENYNDSIIKFYDQHSIFILPSFTEAHPQVLDEALARNRPVIVFKEISHVKRDREGVFVCDRNIKSLANMVNYISSNYENISTKIKGNKLPTQENFIKELSTILFKK